MEFSKTPSNLENYSSDHYDGKLFNNESGYPYNYFEYKGGKFDSLNFFFNADCNHRLPSRNPKNDFLSNKTRNTNKSTDEDKADDNDSDNKIVARCWNIGHATVLIQLNDFYIITDPIFESYASPAPGFIMRSTPAACSISELPPIDIILISHNHYDHLNKPSLRKIKEKNPNSIILCPLQLGQHHLKKWKINDFIEFDWRQYIDFGKKITNSKTDILRITSMPSRHHSARSGFDWDEVLWCSWLLNINDKISIYFPGDTAVGPQFSEIYTENNKLKPLDLLICPIGPQLPAEMMRNVHLDAVEGKKMSEDIHAKVVVPIHHGVFPLGFRPEKTDLQIAVEAWKKDKQNDLICWKIGGRIDYDNELKKFVVTDDDQIMEC